MSRIEDIIRSLPAGLTEADVIDMVDGAGAVTPERERALIDAIKANPRIGLLVKQLRADRTALQAAGHAVERAPANLVELIDARLDRAALSELVHEAEEAPAPIPINSVQIPSRGRGLLAVLAEGVWSRRLATAASIAIVGTLGYIGIREIGKQWTGPSGPTSMTSATPGTSETLPSPSAPEARELAAIDQALAHPGMSSDAAAEILVGPPLPSELAASAALLTDPVELTAAEAVRLAQAGRLVITVRSRHLPATLRHLEALSGAARAGDVRWRSYELAKLPAEFASLAAPLSDSVAGGQQLPGRPDAARPLIVASDGGQPGATPSAVMADEPTPLPAALRAVVKSVRVVRMRADAQTLGDLLRDLNISKDQTAQFHILAPGAELDQRPSLEAESVLWWSAGPESWSTRIAVPIQVQVLE